MKNNQFIEFSSLFKNESLFAGIDEAGRGALAGPVTIALCILKPLFYDEIIMDSKKLTSNKRKIAEKIIKQNSLYFDIVSISHSEVDKLNVKNATKKGMKILINRIPFPVDHIFIDWEVIKHEAYKISSFPKGEDKSINIAAASILAKEARDLEMIELDLIYPEYGFCKNKGYGTKQHRDAICRIKGTSVHRVTFEPLKSILNS